MTHRDGLTTLDWIIVVGLAVAPLALALISIGIASRRSRRPRRRAERIDLRVRW